MLCLFCLTTAFAQNSKSGISFQFGAILPSAQFDNHPTLFWVSPYALEFDFSNAGGAMIGASFGIKYTYTFKKTALENSGIRHAKVLLNILLHLWCSGGCQRNNRRNAYALNHTANLTVFRTEIMAPLRDTMSLVHGVETDLHTP